VAIKFCSFFKLGTQDNQGILLSEDKFTRSQGMAMRFGGLGYMRYKLPAKSWQPVDWLHQTVIDPHYTRIWSKQNHFQVPIQYQHH
jgi:hypothetical protein